MFLAFKGNELRLMNRKSMVTRQVIHTIGIVMQAKITHAFRVYKIIGTGTMRGKREEDAQVINVGLLTIVEPGTIGTGELVEPLLYKHVLFSQMYHRKATVSVWHKVFGANTNERSKPVETSSVNAS